MDNIKEECQAQQIVSLATLLAIEVSRGKDFQELNSIKNFASVFSSTINALLLEKLNLCKDKK